MDQIEVQRAWDQLSQAIDAAITLLTSAGESFWATRLEEGRAKIERYGEDSLDSVLGLFGGMGSFNDLVLSPVNGHDGSEVDLQAANDRLWDLREQIYLPAKELRRAFTS